MGTGVRIVILGDFDRSSPSHISTDDALRDAAMALDATVDISWIPTPDLEGAGVDRWLASFDGIWAAPGSPYRSMTGMLNGIRIARERKRPFVGT